MTDREIGLLKGSRKSARLTGSATIGERIERACRTLAELENCRHGGDHGLESHGVLRLVKRANWWERLAAAGSSTNVCYVSNNGNSNYNAASNASIRPLP